MIETTSTTAPATERFRTPRQRAVVALFRTADMLHRAFERVFEPWDLTSQQYNVLRILRGAQPDTLPTMEIAARMMEQTPGITRLLDRLYEKGLVHRERCVQDRRQVLCSITAGGMRLLEALDEPVDQADEAAFAMLTDAEVAQLTRLLDRVRSSAA
jgi:DNA-binding MarR family transcriptional regulator